MHLYIVTNALALFRCYNRAPPPFYNNSRDTHTTSPPTAAPPPPHPLLFGICLKADDLSCAILITHLHRC